MMQNCRTESTGCAQFGAQGARIHDTDKLSDRKFVNKIVTEYLSELN
jgi:hypothetical protein